MLERLSSSQAANEDHTEGGRETEDLASNSVDNTAKVENKVNPNRKPGKYNNYDFINRGIGTI